MRSKFPKLSKRQAISLASLLIILVSLPLAIFLTQQRQIYRGRAVGPEAKPTNVKITNLHGHGFSVSWTSVHPTTGSFQETTGSAFWGTAQNNTNQEAFDGRGQDVSSTTHHVSIFNLNPSTTYYFKIKSGPDLYGKSADIWVKAGAAVPQTTPVELALTGNPHPIYGYIKNQTGSKVAGALVYVRLKKDNSETPSALISTVTKAGEGWVIDAKNARKAGLGSFFDFDDNDLVLIEVQAAQNGVASASLAIKNASPAWDIPVIPVTPTPTPTPTPVSINCVSFESIRINNCTKDKWEQSPRHPDCYTTNPAVTINLNSPGATQMRFGVPPSFDILCSDLDEGYWYRWENYAPVSGWNAWRHSPGVGDKKICVQFRNAAGLSQKCSGAITIVTGTPTPTPTPTPTAGPTATPTPTPTPRPTPTPTPIPIPTSTPTPTPTQAPQTANLTFKIKFQGINQQRPDKTVKIALEKDGNIIATFESEGVSSDENGVYSGKIMNITPDTYDIFIKGWAHLQKKFENIILVEGENSEDWSGTELLAGDADGSNRINIQDVRIAARDYVPDTPSNSPADFNLDGIVNIQDIRFIVINYWQEGE